MNDTNRIYKVYSNVIEMLKDRGYKIEKKYKLTYDKFKKKYYEQDYNIFVTHKKTKNIIGVYFSTYTKNKLQNIKQLVCDIFSNHIEQSFSTIIVLNKKPNNIILKYINQSEYKHQIEVFWTDILQINITKHTLQPIFKLLNESDTTKLLESYNIKVHQLPKLSIQDPICKYYKFPRLSVIKIIRKNSDSINSEYYRYVS
jgi:DNA-directed RNA polymerase subunit H (RpoH/RPB5)